MSTKARIEQLANTDGVSASSAVRPTARAFPARRKSRSGLSLVEVIVSIAIL